MNTIASAQQSPSRAGDFLAIILPLMGLLKINLIGELYIHEVVLLIGLPFFLIRHNALQNKQITTILLLLFLWLLGLIITDVYRETAFEDLLKGWAKVIFFAVSFISLACLIHTPKRALLWCLSSIAPLAVRPTQIFPFDQDLGIYWKFGLGSSILWLVCAAPLYSIYKQRDINRSLMSVIIAHFILGVISFALNSRSFAGICLFTGLALIALVRHNGKSVNGSTLAILYATAILLGLGIVYIYQQGASSGFFGEEAQTKYLIQNSFDRGIFGTILGGRPESLVSTEAIADSPILGHGSWAKDFRYIELLLYIRMFYASEEGQGDVMTFDGLIPTHSYLLGAWVEAGVLGGIFWIFIIFFSSARLPLRIIGRTDIYAIICVMLLPQLIWNILFSPFGAFVRVETGAVLAIFCAAMKFREVPKNANINRHDFI